MKLDGFQYLVAVSLALAAVYVHAGFRQWDVGDYVQNGIIAHYDAIRNVGADQPHSNSSAGCFTITIQNVRHGEYYAVKASAFGKGVSAGINWRNAKRKYVGRAVKFAFDNAGEDGWRHFLLPVHIPADAATMTLTLDVSLADGEKAWFDNVGIYKLHDAPGQEPDPDVFEPVVKTNE